MKTVAVSRALNQAIAALGMAAAEFLQQVHEGAVPDVRTAADEHLHAVREFARCTGVDLSEVPSWNENITNWRAVARLASSVPARIER
ncbi:MAG: hypothetical protein WEB52_10925 [Dehalococcoidia bacterium]